jgi:hypothetical protein
MRVTPLKFLMIAVLLSASQPASAVTLFSDNFTVTGTSGYPATASTGANYQLNAPGRQGGTLAEPTLGYINGFVRDGNEQLGNLSAFPAAPGNGFSLLLANLGSVRLNFNFSTITAAIAITFDGIVKSGNTMDWVSLMIGKVNQNQFILDSSAGILFRANGGTETFNFGIGTDGETGTAPGSNVWQNYTVVLSDTAGTGSAFDGNGSVITYYTNGTLLGSVPLYQLTPDEGYIGFGSTDQLAGVANLTISAIPEPSVSGLVLFGLVGGLFGLHSRRRSLASSRIPASENHFNSEAI